ncbi:MAG: hypothetical protein M3R67_11865, partial [Acidobacteriota bacterium]|nr:hypothetical protein [Acidobacteriota bacterium]
MDILHGRIGWILLVYFVIGCGSTQTSPPASPTSTLPRAPVVNPSSASFWTFNYTLGALQYQVSRSAAIESRSDSSSNREISTNITHELVTL